MTTKAPLTTTKQDILRLLYTYRYLRRDQIQALTGGADLRNTNHRLSQLRHDQYLEAFYSKTAMLKTPAIYYASLEAIRYYKTKPYAHDPAIARLYRSNRRTKAYIDRCLLAADIAIALHAGQTDNNQYDIATPNLYLNPHARLGFLVDTPASPDLAFVRKYNADFYPYCIEIIPSGPAYVVRNKIKAYLDIQQNGYWEDHLGLDAPTLILILGTYALVRAARVYLAQVTRTNPHFKVHLATAAGAVQAVTKLAA